MSSQAGKPVTVPTTAVARRTSTGAKDAGMSRIEFNSATPGYVATDLNGHRGTRTVEQGVRVIVDLATLAEDGSSGGFLNDQGPVPW